MSSDDQQQQTSGKYQETGILYFARIPRDMRPNEIREYFNRFGTIFRQKFVVAETNTKKAQMIRKKLGKSKAMQFKEGWLEFNKHKDAKDAAEQTNAQPVDVKNTRKAAGELWVTRCLPKGYRWEDLVTEMEGEKRMRRMKIQAELQREREINEVYRQLALKEIARRKRANGDQTVEDDGLDENGFMKMETRNVSANNGGGLDATDSFVKEANSIPSQMMKLRRQRKQAAKKSSKNLAKDGDKSNSEGAGKRTTQNSIQSQVNAQNRIAKMYTSSGYRDLYNA